MSRPTDTERGARLAFDIALERIQDLFPAEGQGRAFWNAIAEEAVEVIHEGDALRQAQEAARA